MGCGVRSEGVCSCFRVGVRVGVQVGLVFSVCEVGVVVRVASAVEREA